MAVTKLRLALLEANIPQYAIAQALGTYNSRLSEYANGRRPIPRKHLPKLAEILGCDPEDLVGFASTSWVMLQEG